MLLDLLFIVVVLTSVVLLGLAAVLLLRGRGRQGLQWLGACGTFLAAYVGVVIAVSLLSPQHVIGVGETRCWDDWCLAVSDIAQAPAPGGREYSIAFRLSSRARRVVQREHGVVVYLVDGTGRRFEAERDPAALPFDAALQPGQALTAVRRFRVSGQQGALGVVVGREGSNAIPGLFIIGDDGSLLHRPTIVRIP